MKLQLIPFIPCLILFIIVYSRYYYRPTWHYLRNREPDRMRWAALYSSAELPAVESALADIRSAFLLRSEDVFRLHPDDRLLDLYEAAHPHQGPDELEFELLAAVLSEKGLPACTVTALTRATVGNMIELYLHRSNDIPGELGLNRRSGA